jgi:hypothetical protein
MTDFLNASRTMSKAKADMRPSSWLLSMVLLPRRAGAHELSSADARDRLPATIAIHIPTFQEFNSDRRHRQLRTNLDVASAQRNALDLPSLGGGFGGSLMDETKKTPVRPEVSWIERLVQETGITEDQAQELVVLLGLNWSSLVREARLLRNSARTW